MVGRVISHYRIHSKLGAGGMGVVYKAEDTKLERTVALKFLAPHLVSDEALRKRFEQEAKAVAALDHPNICTVFEIDEAEGSLFLAMALVEGPTVKERIAQRPLKLEEALDIAIQTAEGLRAAHQKGIVHRDIKPANVMVNAQQQVKIMDFGLARLIDATVTQAGSVAGTPAYMSPEQAQGQPTDGRSDIWSLGVMLYEMIAGRLPFPGQNAQAILHAIQQTEPEPVTGLRGGLPMELDWIIGKCLAKNPAERYQHVDDLIVDLSTLRKRLDSGTVVPTGSATRSRYTAAPTGTAPRPSTIRNAALIAAGGLATVAVAFFGVRALRHAPEASPLRTVRFAFTPTQLVRGGNGEVDAEVSISGDGKHIAYVESQGGQLWIRDIDEEQAHPVPGATGVYQAFWSPDAQYIGYTTGPNCRPAGPSMPGCNIVRIPVQGGTPTLITKAQGGFRRASWSSDGETIVYCDTAGMYTVPTRGGSPTRILEHTHIEHPSFLDLPGGGRAFLYQAVDADRPGGHGIYVQVVGEERRRFLILSTSANPYPAYSPSGHIVYVDGTGDSSAIWALPFSLATLQATGKAFPIAQHGSSPAVSRTGTLVYSDVPSSRLQLVWVDRSGKTLSSVGEPVRQENLALSPDGRKLAVQIRDSAVDVDLWMYDLDRGIKTRFTFDSAPHTVSAWSPSGNEITYGVYRIGKSDTFSKASNGNGDARLLASAPLITQTPDWSPDGKFLIYTAVSPGAKSQVLYRERRQDGSLGDAIVFRKTAFNEATPRFSPDGRFVAYVSDESGSNEVYVRDFPNEANQWQISDKGGTAPRWRRDGKEIFYIEQGKLMAVSVGTRPTFSPGTPMPLFGKPLLPVGYEVAPDGKRILILERPAGEPPLSIHVVHNWFEEFRGRERRIDRVQRGGESGGPGHRPNPLGRCERSRRHYFFRNQFVLPPTRAV
jgi:Tol biopolymer transport system component